MRRVQKLLFQEVDLYPFAVLRAVIGFSTLIYFSCFAPYVILYFSEDGFLPLNQLYSVSPKAGYLSLLFLGDAVSWVLFCYGATLVSSLMYALGFRVVVTGPLLLILLQSFIIRNVYVFSGVLILVVQLLLILVFVDTGRVLVLRGRMSLDQGPLLGPYAWARFLICFQVCVVYFKSGFYKVLGEQWMNGEALSVILSNPTWRRIDFSWFLNQEWFCQMLSWTTIAVAFWELFFPVLMLWWPTRYAALAFGLGLHILHFATIEVGMFVPIVLTCYLSFLPQDSVRKTLLAITRLFGRKDQAS